MNDLIPVIAASPLRQRLIDDMTLRKFSHETQRNYLRDVGRFATWLRRSPHTATAEDLRQFQIEQQEAGVPAPTMNSIVAALRFFFTHTLDRPDLARKLIRTAHARKIPVVLSLAEVKRLLEATTCLKHQAALSVAYGAGLRVAEVSTLKVSDIDSKRMLLRIERGKGGRYRNAMLPEGLLPLLRDWWRAGRQLGVMHADGWLFPGRNATVPISTRQLYRIVVEAAEAADIAKRVGPHTPGIGLCDRCGEPLDRAETTFVAENLRERLDLASGLVDPDAERRRRSRDRLGTPLTGLEGGEALDLLCAVATVADPGIRISNDHHVISRRADSMAVIGAVAEAWTALAEWPEGFARLAADRLSRRSGRHGDGNSGNTLHLLFGNDDTRFSRKINDALGSLVRYLQDGTSRGYPIKRAAAVSGATATGLAGARRRGEIPTVFHLNGERPVPLLDRAWIDTMAIPAITASNAAEQLGFTVTSLLGLVRIGLLEPCTPAIGRSEIDRVTTASLDALRLRLADAARLEVPDPLPIRSAMAVVAGRRKPPATASTMTANTTFRIRTSA